MNRLEERRVEANPPRPSPAPITFADWNIAEMVVASGCPLPPPGVQARCCFRTADWAPLAERPRPDAPPTRWTPGWTCTTCAAFIRLPHDWARRRPRCSSCDASAIGTASLSSACTTACTTACALLAFPVRLRGPSPPRIGAPRFLGRSAEGCATHRSWRACDELAAGAKRRGARGCATHKNDVRPSATHSRHA